MSEDIVKLSDYRQKKPDDKLCWVTFIGHPYRDASKEIKPRLTIAVPDGNYKAAIEQVRDDGGFYVHRPIETLFSPWPCAAVEVRHYMAQNSEPDIRPA